MSTALFVLLSAVLSLNSWAQEISFQSRVKEIEDFQRELVEIQSSISSFQQKLTQENNPKLIKKDLDSISVIQMMTEKIERKITEKTYSSHNRNMRNEIAELKKLEDQRKLYTDTQETRKKLESGRNYSEKLNRFIRSIKSRKYNQAKILFYTLTPEEKIIAEKFEQADTYIQRELNVQDHLIKSVSNKKNEIHKMLMSCENAIADIRDQKEELALQLNVFDSLQKELSQVQFDFQFKTWSLGLFNCEQKAGYFVPNKFPNLMMLTNDSNLTSVIKLNPAEPLSYEIVYACKKLGSFGGCLDNQSKELCRLDPECLGHLSDMEIEYDRNLFFNQIKNVLSVEILKEQQARYLDNTQYNMLRGLYEEGRLGYLSLEDLAGLIDPVISFASSLDTMDPDAFFKKVKTEVELQRKKTLLAFPKSLGPKPNAVKVEQTKKSLDYLYNAMGSSLETILRDDVIQNRIFADCDLSQSESGFCTSSREWREKAKVFEKVREVKNLVPDECPRGVFRFDN